MTHKLGLLAMVAQTLVQSALGGQLQSLASETPSELTPAQPAIQDSVVRITADASGLQLVPFLDLPKNGTYWEVLPGGITAPLPVPLFDPSLPVFSISGDIFLVDATEGQIVINPHQSVGLSPTDARAAAVNSEATKVANLISQVQAATAPTQTVAPNSHAMNAVSLVASASSIPLPGGGGTVSGNAMTNPVTYNIVDYGTNLWFAPTGLVSGSVAGFASNTIADVYYEIQSRTNLAQTDWQSEGFIPGSELTNWTVLSVAQGNRPNLFLRLKSWIDSFDIGIPDWWQIEYFGTNGIDPNASVTGDGYSNLQKFDMGLNPTNFYNPNGPPGFFGYLDASGTNAFIAWSPAPGPVTGYSIQRGVSNSISRLYAFSQAGLVNSNASFFKDAGAITNANTSNNVYRLEAVYASSLSATDTWLVSWGQISSQGAPYGPPFSTNVYAHADATGTNVLLSWSPASTVATNYLIKRGVYNTASNAYVYTKIASVSPSTSSVSFSGAITNAANWGDLYGVAAVYPGNVPSSLTTSPINIGATNGMAAPGTFYGYLTTSGTNLMLYWSVAPGSPVKYVIFGATNVSASGANEYFTVGTVQGNVNTFIVTNAFDEVGNNLYVAFSVFAVYADGSLSQAATWQTANAPPAPGGFVAYFDASGTNVLLSWMAPTGAITGYVIQRSDIADNFEYFAGSNAVTFMDTNAPNTGSFDPNYTQYTIQASYPQGGLSAVATATVGSLPAPSGLNAVVDGTGTNVMLSWNPAQGAASSYLVQRGVLNPSTGAYTYTTIGTVGPNTTTFTDYGGITGANSYNNRYTLEAVYAGGQASALVSSGPLDTSAEPKGNLYITANSIRNGSGRWQVMFSGLPTNSPQTIQLTWMEYWNFGVVQTNLSTTNLAGGVFQLPDDFALELQSYASQVGYLTVSAQLFGPNGEPGQIANAGYFSTDAPYFVDGRRQMKQNLNFLLRAAPKNQLFFSVSNAASSYNNGGAFNVSGTNFEEFSFLHHFGWGGDSGVYGLRYEDLYFFLIDDLWPFTANYNLDNYLVNTSITNRWPYGFTNFTFEPNFATNIPAPAILGQSDPYWILQPGLANYINTNDYAIFLSLPPSDWGVSVNSSNTSASLSSGNNLFGLPYYTGCIVANKTDGSGNQSYQTIAPGGNLTEQQGYVINNYASWCPAPTLSLANYYFAPMLPPEPGFTDIDGLSLPGEMDPYGSSNVQPFPVPIEDDFNVTNQTPPIIASVGQPMIIGGWAKYSVGSSGKYAYLGQYFATNVFLINSNGLVTTNTAGVMSPYGEFFPLQTGMAQFQTMPDIDNPSQQGTGVVRIISMCADANHDGILDTSYAGPDFVSPSKPLRYWANDDQDSGDDGGDGVPGKVAPLADGYNYEFSGYDPITLAPIPIYQIHGVRDLVDFFPVYINIGSLFQSNALSAGISITDTNYQFILSQADGVLRFVSTDLTPTNYMNFLRDTNEARNLGGWPNGAGSAGPKVLTTITNVVNGGVPLAQSFIAGIATNNQGIILVEAAAPTTQPLVLTIYHGTNQIAQTSLYLSISGVEQMFRHKNLLMNIPPATPDRLTDASVPNEPDTIDKNFVFIIGYNVNTTQARGWDADFYKRMYWSGSHAKFYGVTWEAADSQVANAVTINLQTNIVNAFLTASNLVAFIGTLPNQTVVAAHSLGNMLTLDALNDYGNPNISTYFMIDAAVAIETIDASAPLNPDMYHPAWTNYDSRLWASGWYSMFTTNDARSTLTWSGRLANFNGAQVYNCYSSGEEVLRDYPGAPPPNLLTIAQGQFVSLMEGLTGEYTWAWQEKLKGLMPANGLLSSDHGGWQFNPYYNTDIFGDHMSPANAELLFNSGHLETNAFFNWDSPSLSLFPFHNDLALEAPYGSSYASSYARANRNRILSDAVPCLTLPVGANPVPSFDNNHNLDMQSVFENGWPPGRGAAHWPIGTAAAGEWHHSDVRAVAYTFTYKLFNQIVTSGNLK